MNSIDTFLLEPYAWKNYMYFATFLDLPIWNSVLATILPEQRHCFRDAARIKILESSLMAFSLLLSFFPSFSLISFSLLPYCSILNTHFPIIFPISSPFLPFPFSSPSFVFLLHPKKRWLKKMVRWLLLSYIKILIICRTLNHFITISRCFLEERKILSPQNPQRKGILSVVSLTDILWFSIQIPIIMNQ